MKRLRGSPFTNAIAALVWLGMVAARPTALPCPMGGHGTEHHASQNATALAAHAMHSEHADASNLVMPSSESLPFNTEPPPHSCDCLAHCCASVAVRPGAVSPTVAIVEVAAEPSTPLAQTSYMSVRADFVLPFAIAPPVSART